MTGAPRTPEAVLDELAEVKAEIERLASAHTRQNGLFAEGKALGLTYVEMARVCGISPEAVRQGAVRGGAATNDGG